MPFKPATWGGSLSGFQTLSAVVFADTNKQAYVLHPPSAFVYLKVRETAGCKNDTIVICTSYPCSFAALSSTRLSYYMDISADPTSKSPPIAGGLLLASSSNTTIFPESTCPPDSSASYLHIQASTVLIVALSLFL
jgi:hypothetical protein